MIGRKEKKSGAAKRSINAPYDQLRHAARSEERELQHHDHAGLRGLLDEYFSLADELELEAFRPVVRVNAAAEVRDEDSRAA
jgi:hypothetical protein